MKRGKATWIFFPIITAIFMTLIVLLVSPESTEARNGIDWSQNGSVTYADSDSVITFPPEPMSEKVEETVYSVLEKEFYGEPMEVRRKMIVTPVNIDPIPVERRNGRIDYFHGPDCQIGPFETNPDGGFIQKRGNVDGFILYEYTNRGKIGPITCPTGTLYLQRDFH